ncbi:hypothetical protein C5S29_16140 [ANME-1 cluster archaeon GoMg3.2]|nr:hypothetical protein [ANME-1 cluster archaeon GoMg3.2]
MEKDHREGGKGLTGAKGIGKRAIGLWVKGDLKSL